MSNVVDTEADAPIVNTQLRLIAEPTAPYVRPDVPVIQAFTPTSVMDEKIEGWPAVGIIAAFSVIFGFLGTGIVGAVVNIVTHYTH